MPRACTICTHPEREAIDKALVAGNGESLREIAIRFAVSAHALNRHKLSHLPQSLLKAEAAREEAQAGNVMAELQRCFERINLLFDACDRWLRDPEDPTRYDIGPRANELMVTYTITGEEGKPVRRKAPLQRLLDIVGERHSVLGWETKQADPRELVLKTAGQLQGQIELLAELTKELNRQPVVNILLTAEWQQVQMAVVRALAPYPDAQEAVVSALEVVDRGR